MTTNTKLEDWKVRLNIFCRAHEGEVLWSSSSTLKSALTDLVAQERAQVVKECMAAIPNESINYPKEHPEEWLDCCGEGEMSGWNAYRAAALEALSRIGQEV